jgi:hypothetical protein
VFPLFVSVRAARVVATARVVVAVALRIKTTSPLFRAIHTQ